MTAERLEHYRYDSESGRLRQREPGGAYAYDASGRTTEDGRWRYRYGAHGRLAELQRAATGQWQAAYRYNALGERVKKLGTSVTYYHYDLEGRLLAETDASGQTMSRLHLNGQHILRLGTSSGLCFFRISSEKFPALESNFSRQITTAMDNRQDLQLLSL